MSEKWKINLKENLDKRICDCEEGAENTETYREFIVVSENEFGIEGSGGTGRAACSFAGRAAVG